MHRKNVPTTYTEARETLKGRDSRTIANNTRLVDLGADGIGLRLHSTDVVTFSRDGSIVLNTGGWQTVTTKDRLNRVIRAHGWSIYANKHVWCIAHRSGACFEFEDGFTIPPAAKEPEGPWAGPHLTAVVKGDRCTAAREATKRGIPAAFLCEAGNGRETVLRVSLEYRDALAHWFGESAVCVPGRGFPDGTCLVFSTHDRPAEPDFTVANHGTLFLVHPQNDVAREHLEEHTGEEAQWFGGALAVEHRYVADLVRGLRDAGFTAECAA